MRSRSALLSISLSLLAALPALGALAVPRTAVADDTDRAAITTTETDGYGYRFKDDLLGAGLINPSDPRLHVVEHAARSLLIRPRTQFIGEMLKSVENL